MIVKLLSPFWSLNTYLPLGGYLKILNYLHYTNWPGSAGSDFHTGEFKGVFGHSVYFINIASVIGVEMRLEQNYSSKKT